MAQTATPPYWYFLLESVVFSFMQRQLKQNSCTTRNANEKIALSFYCYESGRF